MSNTENPAYHGREARQDIVKQSPEAIKSWTSSEIDTLAIEKTSKDISWALKWKFEQMQIPFNIQAFEKTLQDALATVMQNSDIPFIAKRKFLENVNSKVKLLSDVTPVDIVNLRRQRIAMSLWTELLNISGKSEPEIQAHYLQMILTETIWKYITPVALWLNEVFSAEKLIQKDGEFFHKETLKKTEQSLQVLDQKYWFDFSPRTTEFLWDKNKDTRTEFLKLIQDRLLSQHPNGIWLGQMIKNGNVTSLTAKDAEVTYGGKKINVIQVYMDYRRVIQSWRAIEGEVRDTRAIALADGVISKMKNWLGMEQLKSEFDFLEWDNLANKMKNASIADTIILITQFATVAPIAGDALGWVFDVAGAATGVSVDGAKMTTAERAMSGVFGSLGILVVGGWLNRARKAGKMAKIGKVLSEALKSLPNKIESAVKSGLVIPENVLLWLKEFTQRIPRDIGRRLWEMLERLKSWTQQTLQAKFPNTARVVTWEQSRRIPKIKPEELSVDKYALKQNTKDIIKRRLLSSNIKIPIEKVETNIRALKNAYPKEFVDFFVVPVIDALEKHQDLDFSAILRDHKIRFDQFDTFLRLLLLIEDNSIVYTDLLRHTLAWGYHFYNWMIHLPTMAAKLRYVERWNIAEGYLKDNLRNFSIVIWDAWVHPGLTLAKKFQELWIDLSLLDWLSKLFLKLQFESWGFAIRDNSKKQIIDRLLSWGKANLTKDNVESTLKDIIERIQGFLDSQNDKKILDTIESVKGESIRFPYIFDAPESFNPHEWLEYIRTLRWKQRIHAMRIWNEKLKEQLDIIASFPSEIKKSAEKFDYLKDNPDSIVDALIYEFQSKLRDLSKEQRKHVINGIEKYVNKKYIVHKYANDPKYIDNPKQLVADAHWVDISKIKWEVTMDINWANFTFYIHNDDDYRLLYANWNEERAKDSPSSWWYASSWEKIPELSWTISVSNWKKEWRAYAIATELHETRHMDNQIVMPDHRSWDHLSRAKDEIIAFLTDWRSIEKIHKTLLYKWDEALYDYYKDIKTTDPEKYEQLRALYEKELDIAIDFVTKLKEANIPNYLDILAITPVRQWSHLEGIYLSPNLSQQERILKNIQMIFEKTGELHSAINTDLISIFWKGNVELAKVFWLGSITTVMVLVLYLLERDYPEWNRDLRDNPDIFFLKIKPLINPEFIRSYLLDFLK